MNKTTLHASAHKEPPKSHAKKENTPERKITRILKNGASYEQQQWIDYAFARCGRDCIETWQAESGWVLDRVYRKNSNGTRDFGLCQQNSQYHSKFINSPAFKDPYKQLDYCIGIWDDAVKKKRLKTTFYAYSVRRTAGVQKTLSFIYE